MEAITYSHARANLTEVMTRVNDDHAPVVVTNQRAKPVVIISLEDFNSLEETAYLLRDPRRAKRLMTSVEQIRAGQASVRELIDGDPVL